MCVLSGMLFIRSRFCGIGYLGTMILSAIKADSLVSFIKSGQGWSFLNSYTY